VTHDVNIEGSRIHHRGHRFLGEKVTEEAEKIIEGGINGNPRGDSKERLERKLLESGAQQKVTDYDADAWLIQNRYYGRHLVCGAMHQPGTPCYLLPAANPAQP
jgi:hypothetical protein